jgi:hypothetical protein
MNCSANNLKNFKHRDDKALLIKFQQLQTMNGKKEKVWRGQMNN